LAGLIKEFCLQTAVLDIPLSLLVTSILTNRLNYSARLKELTVTDADIGLLHAYILDGKGGAKKLSWENVNRWVPENGVLWLHLDYTAQEAVSWLKENSQLDELVVNALLSEETRPRCDPVGKGLLISLRGINHDPDSEDEDMVSLRLYVDSTRMITTRQRVVRSTNDMAARLENGTGPIDSGDLVTTLAERLIVRMSQVVSDLEENVDTLEEELLENAELSLRGQLMLLRRKAILLRRYLGPQRVALQRLHTDRIEWFSHDHRMQLRETVDQLTRYVEELDSVRERTAVAYEELTSRLTDQLNSRMYLLSIITGVFLPLSFFTGLLGINVGGMPLASSEWGFAIVVGLLTLTAIIELIFFRRQHWL
jgi:zinc transporter